MHVSYDILFRDIKGPHKKQIRFVTDGEPPQVGVNVIPYPGFVARVTAVSVSPTLKAAYVQCEQQLMRDSEQVDKAVAKAEAEGWKVVS